MYTTGSEGSVRTVAFPRREKKTTRLYQHYMWQCVPMRTHDGRRPPAESYMLHTHEEILKADGSDKIEVPVTVHGHVWTVGTVGESVRGSELDQGEDVPHRTLDDVMYIKDLPLFEIWVTTHFE